MSLYTDLKQITNDSQSKQLDAHNAYMAITGPTDLKSFFGSKAYEGKTQAMLHIEKSINPYNRKSGFATLSGQLGILNAEPGRGIMDRNDIGWFYFALDTVTKEQFQQEVTDLINYLIAEGLTVVSNAIGAEMADIVVSWE